MWHGCGTISASETGSTATPTSARSRSVHVPSSQSGIDCLFPSVGQRHVVDIVDINLVALLYYD